ncbi:MAG: AraC family transcriptional regulator [Clostridia bacterium]|nr:AraC family transcriptional regulator [Clostridia bacterium]
MQKRFWSVPIEAERGVYHDIIPLFVGMEHCLPTNTFGPRIRQYYLLHYCISGKGSFIKHETGETYPVSAGQFFTICPEEATTYAADPEDPWVYVWISFSGSLSEKFSSIALVVDYPEDTFLKIAEAVKTNAVSAQYCAAAIFEIMHHLFFNAQQPLDVTGQVRRYIKLNYMEDLSVEEMAQRFGLNRRYLSRLFKERYGESVKECIVHVRMEKAKEFLSSGHSVSEAALLSGYGDVFNFSKMFRKTVGVSPAAYKKSPR